jgi:hypothetical protein
VSPRERSPQRGNFCYSDLFFLPKRCDAQLLIATAVSLNIYCSDISIVICDELFVLNILQVLAVLGNDRFSLHLDFTFVFVISL